MAIQSAMTDMEGLAVVRSTCAKRRIGVGLTMVGLLSLVAEAAQFLPGDPADAGPVHRLVFAVVAAVGLTSGGACLWIWRLPKAMRAGRSMMMEAERWQSKRLLAFLAMPFSLLCLLPPVMRATHLMLTGGAPEHMELFAVGCFLLYLIFFALLIAGVRFDRWAEPVLDDELSLAHRNRALQFGYALLMPGLAGLFVLGLANRNLAIELTPVLAALGVAGPAVRLYLLERAAGRESEAA